MELSHEEKVAIYRMLQKYVKRYPSQNKAAMSLKGTSPATVSTILSNMDWQKVSDEMWRKIARQVKEVETNGWKIVETYGYKEMTSVMEDARCNKNVTWIVGEAGCGKSTAARMYSSENRNVFVVLCSEDMGRSDFVHELSRAIGVRTEGLGIRESFNMILDELTKMYFPLLIFDEADKLIDSVFHYFIDIYNRLEDECGIVFLSTSYIIRRMECGLRYNKKGYNELHSRMGRKFYTVEKTTARDVYAICAANGIDDEKSIASVAKDASDYDFDLRRVKKAIHKTILLAQNN